MIPASYLFKNAFENTWYKEDSEPQSAPAPRPPSGLAALSDRLRRMVGALRLRHEPNCTAELVH